MSIALRVRELAKTYHNGAHALQGVDLDVHEGDFFALLGPNGAGKSTLIGILCSLVTRTSGKVWVFGHDVDTEFAAAKACLGVVPQEFNFNQFETPLEIVVNQGGYYGLPPTLARSRAETYLRRMDLWDKRRAIARTLSGGMKRRLMIARALVHEPRVLILDEPTAGVDIEIRRSMWDFLREINAAGTTIILTTHYLEEAENLCRGIAIIDEGRVIENTRMRDLLSRLNAEVFILDLDQPLERAPELTTGPTRLIDEHTLETHISRDASINQMFAELSARDITVVSLRNKSNRLEQLFMRLLDAGVTRNAA